MRFSFKRHGMPLLIMIALGIGVLLTSFGHKFDGPLPQRPEYDIVKLPSEFVEGNLSTFESITTRRSVRDYSDKAITLEELSTLLYATQGLTAPGKRAAPSAGETYPIETYLIINNVEGLEPGVYHYLVEEHALEIMKRGDFSGDMEAACSGQLMCREAAVDFLWTAVFDRTERKYGPAARTLIYQEAGHISENLYLQANSMGIGVCSIGGFEEELVNAFVDVDGIQEAVIYINTVGKKE